MLVACGEYVPIIGLVWTKISGINLCRYPVKTLLLVGLPAALLAGRGIDECLNATGRYVRRAGTAAFAAVPLFLAIAGWASLERSVPLLNPFFPGRGELAADGLPGSFVFAALVCTALALVGLGAGRVRGYILSVLAVAVVAVDLTLSSVSFLPSAPSRLLDGTPRLIEEIRNHLGRGRFFRDVDPVYIEVPYVEDCAWERAEWLLEGVSFSGATTFLVPMVFHLDIAEIADRRMARLARVVGEVD